MAELIKLNLQLFGGRGTSSRARRGGRLTITPQRGAWSKDSVGFVPHDNLREALGQKGAPKTMGDSVVDTNPNFSRDYKEFSHNCQRCVVAYEARRRGYDVEAQPTFKGDTLNQTAFYDSKKNILRGRWMGAFQNAEPKDVSAKTEKGVIKNVEKQMASYGDGARAVIQILYKSGGGHVFNVEQRNGKTIYVEAQVGRIKNFEETMQYVDPSMVSITRVDNLRLSERAKNFVTPRKK